MNTTFQRLSQYDWYEPHQQWLRGEGGRRANLLNTNLSYANLRYADLNYADLSGADFRYADLRYVDLRFADLSGAKLSYADFRFADLSGTNLSGANLKYAIGNMHEVRSLQCDRYMVTYTTDVMAIGCQQHPIERWWGFTDDEIIAMDNDALTWWRVWKPILQQIIAAAPATTTGHEREGE